MPAVGRRSAATAQIYIGGTPLTLPFLWETALSTRGSGEEAVAIGGCQRRKRASVRGQVRRSARPVQGARLLYGAKALLPAARSRRSVATHGTLPMSHSHSSLLFILMAAPNVTIAVEPMEGGKAMYLPLAAAKSGEKGHSKIILRLRITNNESSAVTVSKIQFSFPGARVLAVTMKGIPIVLDPDGTTKPADAQGTIEAGQTATWSNGRVDLDTSESGENWHENMVYLTSAPPQVRVHVFCSNYGDAATVTHTLAPYTSPTPAGAFILPFAAGDLRDGEYVVTSAWHWANGGANGTQIFAHDISIQGVSGGAWSQLLPGKASSKNDSYRIWDKPIRAMADGVVESWLETMDDNTVLGKFPKPAPSPTSGNHFWINHGGVFVLYAHLKNGSMPAELLQKGAQVSAGQYLGRIGNTGNSTNPHTHIEARKGSTSGALRSMPFKEAWVLDHDAFAPPAASDPWVKLNAQGIPKKSVSIWPASTTPGFKIPAAGIARGGTWANSFWISASKAAFDKAAQDLFEQKGRRLIWVSTFVENGKRKWAGIARAGTWASAVWTSSSRTAFEAKAQKLFTDEGKRLIHVHTYVEGSKRYWMGIARSGTWASSFWISEGQSAFEQKAQELFDKHKRRLTFVHTYVENGKRYWIGLAQGGTWANSFWVSEGLSTFSNKAQALFDEKGRRLVHVHTYQEGGKRYWVGIARSGDWANSFWYSGDLDSFNRRAQDLFDNQGRRLVAVEFLDT